MELAPLVNELTLVHQKQEYDAIIALASHENWSSEETYIALADTKYNASLNHNAQVENTAWMHKGLEDGTLQFDTPTSPDGALNGRALD